MSPPTPTPTPVRTGYLLIALAAFLWGTLGIASRQILQSGIAPLELSVWRATIGGALFALQALWIGRTHVDRRDFPALATFAAVGVSLFYLSYQLAVRAGGAALAAILLYTAPAWVAVASVLWLHEAITRGKLVALTLTLSGVALVAVGTSGGSAGSHVGAAALIWGLVSGLAYASYYLFGKRYFARYHTATLFMYALPLGALLLLPWVPFAAKGPATWGWIAFVGVVPTFLALQVYSAGLKRIAATSAVTVATLEPVVAALLAYLVWGEALGALGYFGAALVLAGVLVMARE